MSAVPSPRLLEGQVLPLPHFMAESQGPQESGPWMPSQGQVQDPSEKPGPIPSRIEALLLLFQPQ